MFWGGLKFAYPFYYFSINRVIHTRNERGRAYRYLDKITIMPRKDLVF